MRSLIILILSSSIVLAHDFYPRECCSDRDCYKIEDTDVEFRSDGWLIKITGEVIPHKNARVSPDGDFHRCSFGGRKESGTICLFVRAGSS